MKTFSTLFFLIGTLFAGVPVAAQTYPSKPIRLIVPYSAGSTDTLARLIAGPMSKTLGQPVVVENKPGAGGAIGAQVVTSSLPDGYTICFCGMAPALTLRLLDPNLPYDPARDFAPVGQVVNIELVLVARANFEATTVAQVVARAKANPGKISLGLAGHGSSTHLTAELFKHRAGISTITPIYKGDGQLLTDLLGAQIDMGVATVVAASSLIRSGKIKAIAVTGTIRSRALPEVPTVAESGIAGFSGDAWGGLSVAAGTPAPIIKQLNEALLVAVKDPAVLERLPTLGAAPVGSSPEAFAAFLRSETEKLGGIIREAGIKLEQ